MYSNKTLNKIMSAARDMLREFRTNRPEGLRVTISNGNRKIGRVMNVSTMPGLACGNCTRCLPYCYDVKACVQYPENVLTARVKNYYMATEQRDEFFRQIDDKMSRRRLNKYFRWHVAGDILDLDYFARMVENARRHPDFMVWTYTKMYHIVNLYVAEHGGTLEAAIPANLCVMFSKWDGMPMDNPYGFPVFYCILKEGNVDNDREFLESLYRCPGNCDVCKAAGRGCLARESTAADEH